MFLELLDAQRYFFNPYSIPPLATAAGLLFVLLQFLLHGLQRSIRTPLILAFLAATVWLFAFHFMYSSKNEDSALIWARMGYLGVPFISVAMYDLAVRIRGLYQSQKPIVWGAWVVSGIFALLAFDSDLIARVTRQWWGFYPLYGHAGVLFVGYFSAMAIGSLWHLYRAYQGAASTKDKRMVQFMIFGLIAGYLGGVDFMAKLGASIYPFGYFCIFVSALLMFQGVEEATAYHGDARDEPMSPDVAALRQTLRTRLHAQQRALLSALKTVATDTTAFELIKQLLEAIGDGLDLERIAVWHYDRAASMLQCRNIYRPPSRFHRVITGQFIQPASDYLNPLLASNWLAVENIGTDPRMRGFHSVYLNPDMAMSALEVPIHRDDQFLGVLSCHAAGKHHQWHRDEREFLELIVGLLAPLLEISTVSEALADRFTRLLPTVRAVMEQLLRRDQIMTQTEGEARRE